MRYTEKNAVLFSESSENVAIKLLGCALCRKLDDGTVVRFRITEVEAYDGGEEFCYGHGGPNPLHKSIMFYSIARLCDYASMLMISCGSTENADNVLIRGAEQITAKKTIEYDAVIALHDAVIGGQPLSDPDLLTSDEVWLEPSEFAEIKYCKHKRINIPSDKKWRFCLQND